MVCFPRVRACCGRGLKCFWSAAESPPAEIASELSAMSSWHSAQSSMEDVAGLDSSASEQAQREEQHPRSPQVLLQTSVDGSSPNVTDSAARSSLLRARTSADASSPHDTDSAARSSLARARTSSAPMTEGQVELGIQALAVQQDTCFAAMGACYESSVVALADGKQDVDMANFFKASNLFFSIVISLKPVLGMAGGQVVGAISTNLEVSQAGFDSNPQKRNMLSSYLNPEHIPPKDKSVHELKWLLRALQFFFTIFIDVFEDRGNAQAAYNKTLRQYHPWIVRSPIEMGLKGMPGKAVIAGADGLCLKADLSKEQRSALVVRDAPRESRRALQVVELMIQVLKHHSKWND